jgi:hypothetical protein
MYNRRSKEHELKLLAKLLEVEVQQAGCKHNMS